MNRSVIRWILVALMALSLVLTLSCPYIAYAEGTLPLDYLEGGKAPKDEGWTFDENGYPLSYQDSTIEVTFEHEAFEHTLTAGQNKGSKAKNDEWWVVRIKIRDVSQLRTAVAKNDYMKKSFAPAESMAAEKNAVVAMNGDFFKYENDVGYLVRQGELIRDATDNSHGQIFDMLLIDSAGNFHVVYAAVTETIDEYVAENLTPYGLTVLDTFNIGPVLVLNGEAQDVSQATMVHMRSSYQWDSSIERIAIVQTGELEYAIVTVGTRTKTSGLSMQEFADFIAEKCPDAILAYNLDGGGSANLTGIMQKKNGTLQHVRLNRNNDIRDITDILYFASAED